MIPRHTKGVPIGIPIAAAGRVVIGDGHTTIDCTDGRRLVLASGPGDGSRPGVFSLRREAPFENGDVVVVDPSGGIELLFRPSWRHNSILVTQRCDSLCVMCSQPPKEVDDSPRVDVLIDAVRLLPAETASVGLTGGEPSLLGPRLVDLVRAIGTAVPTAAVHVLSNGRGFRDPELARLLGSVRHPDLMVGVPLYADHDDLHDAVVGRRGAFEETLAGIENLGRAGVAVEIRVVLHKMTVPRLVQLCAFIHRNIPYAAQVALMGLEPTGFAVPNLSAIWIDPADYVQTLGEAIDLLATRGLLARVYNVQLCTLPRELWPFATRSISEWKNEYLPACASCSVRGECCGFFSSAVQRSVASRAIAPIAGPPMQAPADAGS